MATQRQSQFINQLAGERDTSGLDEATRMQTIAPQQLDVADASKLIAMMLTLPRKSTERNSRRSSGRWQNPATTWMGNRSMEAEDSIF
jgi:hypothetical protein